MAGNSKSVKKSEQTKKEKYGTDYHARIGASGGRHRSRGYFGKLKDEGKTAELKNLAHRGAEKSNQIQASKRRAADTGSPDGDVPGTRQ